MTSHSEKTTISAPGSPGQVKSDEPCSTDESMPQSTVHPTADNMTATARDTAGDNSMDSKEHLAGRGSNLIDLDATGIVADDSPVADVAHEGRRNEEESVMDASVTTLKPSTVTPPTATAGTTASTIKYLDSEASKAADTATYIDPTPPTPVVSHPPSRSPSNAASRSNSRRSTESSPTRSDAAYDDKRYTSEDENEGGSRTEIRTIMEQFSEEGGGPGLEEVMSPRLEIASPMLAAPIQHPPRKSSLEPLAPTIAQQIRETQGLALATSSSGLATTNASQEESDDQGPPVPPKDPSTSASNPARNIDSDLPLSPTVSLHRPPPPEPEPEPTLPFDFHRFLEQLRNKKADPVARYLKSFLSEFGKRQWMVHEQVKIISDFLAFIANKMAVCEVWRELSDAEFDNAREGMEKLVMNRLYTQTFSPAIPPPQPIPGAKPKRRGGERPMGPGRRGQHQEDVERDEILTQKINIYNWIREQHLDIPPVGDGGKRFLKLAQQELLKIKTYRAPRDKIICVLNCCKVIFGLLKHNKSDSSADSFMPLLIYVVLQANPDHLVSNVQYILRFRNQDKLGGEAGYYLSSLMGVIQFVENMDRTTLTISDDEFEKNVEAAVSAIAEKHQQSPPPLSTVSAPGEGSSKQQLLQAPGLGDNASPALAGPRLSTELATAEPASLRLSFSPEGEEERDAITGLLRTIQRPLSSIGRIFSDEASSPSKSRSLSPVFGKTSSELATTSPSANRSRDEGTSGSENGRLLSTSLRHRLSAEEAAARQASAEAAEAQRLHHVEHASVVETLAGMFPDLDREIISDVVYQKEGRVGSAVDACLALSA